MTQNHPDAKDFEVIPAGATTGTVSAGQPRVRKFNIPDAETDIWLRDGIAGFLLADLIVYLNRHIERIDGPIADDGGYVLRPIAGTDTWSIHAYANAFDYNWRKHPQHTRNTFTTVQRFRIRRALKRRYQGVIVWGGDWSEKFLDEMHFQIQATHAEVRTVALPLLKTKRGRSIASANPGLRKVIRG